MQQGISDSHSLLEFSDFCFLLRNFWRFRPAILQKQKISPKRKFLGRTSHGHPWVIRADIPVQNFGQGGQILEKTHFGADIHKPKARTSTTLQSENFGLNFHSLILGIVHFAIRDSVRDSTNGAFVKRGVWSVTDFFSVIAWVPATLKLRGMGMSLVDFSRHPPPPQRLILPSGQTLIHSSHHLSCPNQEPG